MLKLILVTLLLIHLTNANLKFVGEICRHGARASDAGIEDPKYFPNGPGELTALGMRQHYLIGHYLRLRYMKDESFLDTAKTDEIYVQSTQVPRTIQSAQCQLLGLYRLDTSEKLQESWVDDAVPHIIVHEIEKIKRSMGLNPIENNYHPIPVHNHNMFYEDDVLGYADCPKMNYDYEQRVENETFWKPQDDHYGPLIYDKLAKTFDVPREKVTFMVAYILTDILVAERFQGAPSRADFTDNEWLIIEEMQKPLLDFSISEVSSRVFASRYIRPFIEMMKKAIGIEHNQTVTNLYGDVKMILFSSHDLQLNQMLKVLNPSNLNLHHIEYASTLIFELRQSWSPLCWVFPNRESCYYVKTLYNGIELQLPGCYSTDCSFPKFVKYLERSGDGLYTYDEIQEVCYKDVPSDYVVKKIHVADKVNFMKQ